MTGASGIRASLFRPLQTESLPNNGMSLNSVQPTHGLQTPSSVTKTGAGDGSPVAGGGNSVTDSVRLSDQGRMMSRLSAVMPPTPENVRKLSAGLAGDLKNLFRQSALDARRGIAFDVDSYTGEVSIKGNRPDAPAIATVLGRQPNIAQQIQNIAALSRHVVVTEQAADTRQANRVAQSAAQINSMAGDYTSRFSNSNDAQDFAVIPNRPGANAGEISRAIAGYANVSGTSGADTNFSLAFNGTDVQVYANGKPWISSRG
jgi:hypothetical protein